MSFVTLLALAASLGLVQQPKHIDLHEIFGQDVQAFEKAMGVKLKESVDMIPDMVPGKSYTDAETAALPKIKSYTWKAEVPGLGTVSLGRTEKDSHVVDAQFSFPKGSVSTWQGALQKIGISESAAKAKPMEGGGYSLVINFKSAKWNGFFYKSNPDADGKPWLEISER